MGTVFVVHLSRLDYKMILKLLLLCSLFLLTASQEDDDAGKETAEDDSASQPISSEEDQDLEENAASQTNSSEVVGGNRAIGRSAKGLRWNPWPSWCYWNRCGADRNGFVHPQCCQDSHFCQTHNRANCQFQFNQINHINNYYGGRVRQVWVWCDATRTWKSMLQMQQPHVVNQKLLELGAAGGDAIKVTLCTCIAGTWQAVKQVQDATVGHLEQLDSDDWKIWKIGIKDARYGYIAEEESQVTPTCADMARHAHAPACPRGSRNSWVTLASWNLKWCKREVGRNWDTLRIDQKYGGCCWNSFYRTRASQCSWTESTG